MSDEPWVAGGGLTRATTDPVRNITCDDGTEESTCRKDGGDEGVVASLEGLCVRALYGVDEQWGTGDTIDVTGAVGSENDEGMEEKTTYS